MDEPPAQVILQNEAFKDQEPVNSVTKSQETDNNSPTRSSVKSVQNGSNVTNPKTNRKSVPKLDGNKVNRFQNKIENRSQSKTSLYTNEEGRKITSLLSNRKNVSPVMAAELSNSTAPMGKTKIPSMKQILSSMNRNVKTGPQLRTLPEKSQPKKKPLEKKQTLLASKSNINLVKADKSISKFSFLASSSMPIQGKVVPKSQSARSTIGSLVPGGNRKSASNASTRSSPCPRKKEELKTNLRKMTSTAGDHNKIESLEKKLEAAQTEFLAKIKNLKDTSPGKLNCEYKFVTLVKNDECELLVKEDELCQLPKKFPSASVNDFKQKLKTDMEQWFSSLKDETKATKDNNNIDIEKYLKSHDIWSFIDELCSKQDANSDKQNMNMKKDLEEYNKSFKESEKKLNDLVKQHEEQCLELERALKEKADNDLAKKKEEVKELQKHLKSQEKQIDLLKAVIENTEKQYENENKKMNEELKMCKECISIANKKLQTTEQQLSHEQKELSIKSEAIKNLENSLMEKEKLAESLNEMTAKVEELQEKVIIKDKACKECVEHLKQITELNNKIECLEADKTEIQQHMEKLERELLNQTKLQDKLRETEIKIQNLQKELENKEKSPEVVPDYSKEVQLEFARFRQADAERRREIEKLNSELSKAQFNISQLEQQIQRDQQLLDVRSDLINSLQTNEKTHRIHIEELFAQVSEKNNTINELNSKVQEISEEFRNLFTTLSSKQMEVASQEHIIKLLEESNDRSQMLRVKQEEKIARMEEELSHLKQSISIYQANILSGNSGEHLLFAPVLPSSTADYNENFYYYASQRKRKRQVDINVKKYEA